MKTVTSIVLNPYVNDSRVIKETKSLRQAGYDVNVVALHDGRAGLAEYEILDGIPVHRIRLVSKSWSKWTPVQLLKYVEFCVRAIYEIKSDIIHCNDLNALPMGYILKWMSHHKKIIYDAHELESEVDGQSAVVRCVLRLLEGILIKKSDIVFTVSDGIANWYKNVYQIEKPCVVINAPRWQIIERQNVFQEEEPRLSGKKIFLYQGGLCSGRGIEYMLDAFARRDDDKAVLMLMGYGPMEDQVKKAAQMHGNIFYHEAVSPQELWMYTASADYGMIITENTCLSYYYSLPNKLFEYVMAGLPVILNDLYECSALNNKYSFGVSIKDLSVDAINAQVDFFLSMGSERYKEFSANARKMAKELAWEQQADILLQGYEEAIRH